MKHSIWACVCYSVIVFACYILLKGFYIDHHPHNLKAVFVGCARDIEKEVNHSVNDIVRLASEFDDYAVLIYENDSTDKTLDLLRDLSKRNNRVNIISEKDVQGTRTQRLARGRNILLSMSRNHYPDFDFLVVMDMDYTRSNTDSIVSIVKNMPLEWSGITAVSRHNYYDWWAFRSSDLNMDYDCHEDEKNIRQRGNCNEWGKRWSRDINTRSRRVESAFNGIGVYRLSHIPPEAKYVGETIDGNSVCEHVSFHSHLSELYIEPRLITSTWDN
jgi:glycosyltransferase involved in cell wall biosynthesis